MELGTARTEARFRDETGLQFGIQFQPRLVGWALLPVPSSFAKKSPSGKLSDALPSPVRGQPS